MKLDHLKDKMKAYGMKPLAEEAGVARASLYNLFSGENFESETLDKVARVLGLEYGFVAKVPSYEDVCNQLACLGAPLLADKSKPQTMSLEEATKWGLKFSKTHGLLESVMPFFLLKNFKSYKRAKLLAQMDEEKDLQLLGYYLDLAYEYSDDKKLKEFAALFYQEGFAPLYFGGEKPTARALEVMKAKKNRVADKWNVYTLGSMEDYFLRFKKWK